LLQTNSSMGHDSQNKDTDKLVGIGINLTWIVEAFALGCLTINNRNMQVSGP